jgi:hypothetical protein
MALSACASSDPSSPMDGDDASVASALDPVGRGAAAVERRACGGCHDPTDASQGRWSGQSQPRLGTQSYPANLTPDVETGLGAWPADKIVRAIRLGVDVHDGPLCAIMPRFGKMTEDEAYAIVAFLESQKPVRRAIPRSVCPPLKPAADAGAN